MAGKAPRTHSMGPPKASGGGKKGPPTPKHTANLPPGLAAYWTKKGVPK